MKSHSFHKLFGVFELFGSLRRDWSKFGFPYWACAKLCQVDKLKGSYYEDKKNVRVNRPWAASSGTTRQGQAAQATRGSLCGLYSRGACCVPRALQSHRPGLGTTAVSLWARQSWSHCDWHLKEPQSMGAQKLVPGGTWQLLGTCLGAGLEKRPASGCCPYRVHP